LRRSKLRARLANIRKDAAHKLTTDLTRRLETIVIEDLNGSGMAKNHSNRSLAGAVLDCGFHEIRRQLQDKAARRLHSRCRSVLPVNANLLVLRLSHRPERA
jgi:putative transposase